MSKNIERNAYWSDPTACEAIARADHKPQGGVIFGNGGRMPDVAGVPRMNHNRQATSIDYGLVTTARAIHSRRAPLHVINVELSGLNIKFPGERKKPYDAQDPVFRQRREILLEKKRLLAPQQGTDRRGIRGRQRFLKQLKQNSR